MNITLCGYGVIGKAIHKLLENNPNLKIKNVYVRKEKEVLPFFSNNEEIVEQEDIKIVMECLNGLEPANTLIRKALKAKKHVITSNKAVIATYLEDYVKLAKDNDTTIQVEACVAGGIPFIDALLRLQRLEDIQGYEGIFNGTSNYILDKMSKEDLDYPIALQKAQELGYAEKDPTNDVEGIDVWYKSNIANMLAYQTQKVMLDKPIGISKITKEDIAFAKMQNKTIRHLSISRRNKNTLATIITPCFLNQDQYLANVPNNYNAQLILAPSFDQLGYYGQGAGGSATAQAMIANALDTFYHQERKIILTNKMTYDASLIKEDWIVRGSIKPNKSWQNIKDDYYIIKNSDSSIIEEIYKQDKEAMIAIWR